MLPLHTVQCSSCDGVGTQHRPGGYRWQTIACKVCQGNKFEEVTHGGEKYRAAAAKVQTKKKAAEAAAVKKAATHARWAENAKSAVAVAKVGAQVLVAVAAVAKDAEDRGRR